MHKDYCWGIDLGGTKIEAVVLDPNDDFKILIRQRVPTNAHLGYRSVLNNIGRLIDELSERMACRPQRIGIGTPGSIDPVTKRLRNCNSVYLNGQFFRKDLEEVLGVPVKMTNDANCFALSEYKLGIVKREYPEARTVFAIIMGTGVGSGIIFDGHIIEGANRLGGEWGHNFLDDSGTDCYCGRKGCVETILSGPSLEKFYYQLSNNKCSLSDIVSSYRAGNDPYAKQTMDRLFYFFPRALGPVINIIDPDLILIGGGLGNIDELYSHGTDTLTDFVFSDHINTPIVKPLHGDSSGVLGAALLWT